jgi:small neutral amino acid transporter SnatA (MarC family)
MQEAAQNILLVIVTLFPIVDPLGGSPFFLALTREYSPEARKALSWRIAVNSFILLVATYFVGTDWIGADRGQHFALLWLRRPLGANPGSYGDDGDHAIVGLFPVCIGVQIAWNGMKALLESVTLHIG